MPKSKSRNRAVEALMALAAEKPWDEVTLQAVAERAGLSLAELRADYDGRLAILADYVRQVDETVLKGLEAALENEPPRDRLFDILFARFEAHAPHKAALKAIARAALRDPLLALELNRIVATSMAWMLSAAGLSATGARGIVKAQGLALVWARVMRVFLEDEDPGLSRTMAALDKRLGEAERIGRGIERLDRVLGGGLSPRRKPGNAALEPVPIEEEETASARRPL